MVRFGCHFFSSQPEAFHYILLLLCGLALTNENKSFHGQQVQLFAPSPQTAASLLPSIPSLPPSLSARLSLIHKEAETQGNVMLVEATQT